MGAVAYALVLNVFSVVFDIGKTRKDDVEVLEEDGNEFNGSGESLRK
jgi:hypothetical protein